MIEYGKQSIPEWILHLGVDDIRAQLTFAIKIAEDEKARAATACMKVLSLQMELTEARARIAELEVARQWVSVGERLPEENVTVGILIKSRISENHNIFRLAFRKIYQSGEFEWVDPQDNYVWGGNVTHWMPLPPAPASQNWKG